MQRHETKINLTKLKKAVAKYWADPELKEKYFEEYTPEGGEKQVYFKTITVITEPKYKLKNDGSKIESDKAVLHDSGFIQASRKVGEEWENENFAQLMRWIDKVDMSRPDDTVEYPEEPINIEDIPFS